MEPFMPCVLLALALSDSLPVPFYEVDGPRVAYTVAEVYADTLSTWACFGLEPTVESPEGNEVAVFAWCPGQDTGIEGLPTPPSVDVKPAPCGLIFSWED